jgi:hypothetical protein
MLLRHAAPAAVCLTLPALRVTTHPKHPANRRKRVPNVAYGSGTHVCIGEYLSLVELECAFKGLFTRLPNLKVGPTFISYPKWIKCLIVQQQCESNRFVCKGQGPVHTPAQPQGAREGRALDGEGFRWFTLTTRLDSVSTSRESTTWW